jgi:hypothetical protein
MPKTRHEVAIAIGSAFMPVKRATANLSAAKFRLVATLMESRHTAAIPYSEAEQLLADARRIAEIGAEEDALLARMHLGLADLGRKLNLDPTAYGDGDATEKKMLSVEPAQPPKLTVVA